MGRWPARRHVALCLSRGTRSIPDWLAFRLPVIYSKQHGKPNDHRFINRGSGCDCDRLACLQIFKKRIMLRQLWL